MDYIYSPKSATGHEDRPAVLNQYRRWNRTTALSFMVIIFALYVLSANRAPDSDNVGMVFVPFVLITMWGPVTSFVCGLLEATKALHSPGVGNRGYISLFLATQPRLFLICGAIGAIVQILVVRAAGWEGLMLPLCPFWAMGYLF
jgi:hypothetical protein